MATKTTAVYRTDKSALDKFLFELTGTDENEFFKNIRLEPDPWSAIEEVIQEVKQAAIPESEAFIDKAKKFLAEFGETIQEQIANRDNELHYEDKFDRRYSNRQFYLDKKGWTKTTFAVTDVPTFTTREAWLKTTGTNHLIHLTEWGNFSMDITKKYTESLLRVTSHTRKKTRYVGIGAVQVNMSNGHAQCWVSNCKWELQLSHNPENNGNNIDKEWCEYQILVILQHLGEHTTKNPSNYWTPINQVKVKRDDKSKMAILIKENSPQASGGKGRVRGGQQGTGKAGVPGTSESARVRSMRVNGLA